MSACFLKITRDTGNQSYAFTHTYLTFHSLRDNRRIMEKLLTQQGKSYTVKVSSKNIHSPLTPVASDIWARQKN